MELSLDDLDVEGDCGGVDTGGGGGGIGIEGEGESEGAGEEDDGVEVDARNVASSASACDARSSAAVRAVVAARRSCSAVSF